MCFFSHSLFVVVVCIICISIIIWFTNSYQFLSILVMHCHLVSGWHFVAVMLAHIGECVWFSFWIVFILDIFFCIFITQKVRFSVSKRKKILKVRACVILIDNFLFYTFSLISGICGRRMKSISLDLTLGNCSCYLSFF